MLGNYSLEKKGILISYQSSRLSYACLYVTLLANVSSPKPLDIAASNLYRSHYVEGTEQHFV